jgi:hypothetical protein
VLTPRPLALLAAIAALIATVALLPVALASGMPLATSSKAKCPKGKKLVVVKKNGKVVRKNGKPLKRCVKRKPSKPKCRTASASGCAIPAPAGLFEAPGKVLEGEAAKPFLQKYLANSTFTDCPRGWGVGGCSVEQRYSHAADATFHYCRLTSTSGADIVVTDEYGVEAAKVEPDGSWTFREVVYNSGNYSHYEWNVSTSGVVTGAYQFTPSSQIERLGPLQYLGGVAKDCSY